MHMIDVYQATDDQANSLAGREIDVDKITVLIVDDAAEVRDGLHSILRAYSDIDVVRGGPKR